MESRYDNLDNTKWEHLQVRVNPHIKERFKLWCDLNNVPGKMSGAITMFINAVLTSEQFDPQPTPIMNRFESALNRIMPFFKHNNGNGKIHKFYR